MKQVEVTILGQGYILGCTEGGEDALLRAVATVDREMSGIRDAGKIKARERIAVLAALNVAYRLAEAEDRVAQLEHEAAHAGAAQARTADRTADRMIDRSADRAAAGAHEGGSEGGPEGALVDAPLDADGQAAVEALIRRIDGMLAEDGRLL